MAQKTTKREHTTGIMIGERATGKSTDLLKLAKGYVDKTAKRALILDVNGAPAYKDLPLLTVGELQKWRHGNEPSIARFYLKDLDRMFAIVEENFRNGFLVFEDCTKYIDANPSRAIKSFLVDHRMMGLDLFWVFHSVGSVPPFFWKMTNYIILKKTVETFRPGDKYKYTFFSELLKAHQTLSKSKDRYKSIVIQTNI